MSNLKSSLKKFVNVFASHPTCVANAVMLAVTAGLEQAFEEVVFKCPKKQSSDNKWYALVTLIAPAVALLILGILGSNLAWRLCQGTKYRTVTPYECDCCTKSCCGNFITVLLRALIIPLTWVFVALMDGDLYMCYYWSESCPPGSATEEVTGVPCTKNTPWEDDLKIKSQLWGWIFLAVCLLFGLITVFCHRCYSKRTYLPHLYSNGLKRNERMHIEKLLKEQAEKDAERHAGALMMGYSKLSAKDWESICRECTKTKDATAAGGKDTAAKAGVGEGSPTNAAENDTANIQKDTENIQYHSPLQEWLAKRQDLLKQYDEKAARAQKQNPGNQLQRPPGNELEPPPNPGN